MAKNNHTSTALLRFSTQGELEDVFLNADSDEQEEILKRGLASLMRPALCKDREDA